MTSQDMHSLGVALFASGVLGGVLLCLLAWLTETSSRFIRRWMLISVFVGSVGIGIFAVNDPAPPVRPAWEMPNIQNSECDVLMWTAHNNQWVCLPTEQMGQDSEWGNDVSR